MCSSACLSVEKEEGCHAGQACNCNQEPLHTEKIHNFQTNIFIGYWVYKMLHSHALSYIPANAPENALIM